MPRQAREASSSPESKLRAALQEVYDRHKHEVRVSPAWLATETMITLDKEKLAPALVYLAAHLELRQLARELCRAKWEPGDEIEQHELFPDLQSRYPIVRARGEDPEYVLLDHMTLADCEAMIARLRAEASAKLEHARALQIFAEAKFGRRTA